MKNYGKRMALVEVSLEINSLDLFYTLPTRGRKTKTFGK